jgi:hypothetical protein
MLQATCLCSDIVPAMAAEIFGKFLQSLQANFSVVA